MINIVIALLLPIYGAFMSRFHGGGFKGGVNKQFKNALWSLPFGIIAWLCGGDLWICALAVALCWVGVTTGHGRGLGSDEPMREDFEPEKSEYIIPTILNLLLVWPKNLYLKLFKKSKVQLQLDEYTVDWVESRFSVRAYKHLIMALTGFTAVSGGVIAFMTISPLAALVIACGGLLKGVAYEIGTFIFPNQTQSGIKNLNYKTEIGEFIRGLFAYGGLSIGFIIS